MYSKLPILLLIPFIFFSNLQPKISTCQVKRFNVVAGPIKDHFTLINIQPGDPIYNPTVQVLQEIQNAFLVYPIFFFYNDDDENNAMASSEVTQANGPDGTVIFGKHLFNREYIKTTGGTTIPVIIAHEYGHIVDFKYGVLEHVGVKKTELFADFFAGLYMYLRVIRRENTDVAQCYKSFRSMGDTNFGDEDAHGTPDERYRALKAGYDRANYYLSQGRKMDLNMAIEEGKNYITSLPE